MKKKICYSCGIPLDLPGVSGASDEYCAYCSTMTGKLKPWDEVLTGTAQYFMTWQPGLTMERAMARAERYLTAMPAWAPRVERS